MTTDHMRGEVQGNHDVQSGQPSGDGVGGVGMHTFPPPT